VAIDFFLIACTETIRKSLSGFFAKRGAEHTGSRWLNHPRLPPRSGIFIRESIRAHLQMPPLTAPKHPGRSSINRRHSPWWLRPDVQTQTAVESDPNCSGRALAAVFGRIPFTGPAELADVRRGIDLRLARRHGHANSTALDGIFPYTRSGERLPNVVYIWSERPHAGCLKGCHLKVLLNRIRGRPTNPANGFWAWW